MEKIADLKERCREVVVGHLTSKGYPNLTRRGIINELKPMWLKMEALGLTEELHKVGWNYARYVDAAVKAAQEAAIFEHLGTFVRANPRRVK